MSIPPPPPQRPSGPPKPPAAPTPTARAEATFNSALERPPAEREAYVAQACGDDTVLIAEVRELLAAHDAAGGFMADEEPLSPEVEEQLARLKSEEEGERIGRYKLLQQIGEGGFGTVWMAEQIEPVTRRVALKIIKMGMDTKEVIARFEAERQALALMDHPNIAQVLDAGATDKGRPFFVMELVKGIPITQFCDETQLGTRERLALFGDVCSAINHAHQKGVIHRDIKPSNVMVTLHGEKPVVKVIDFGIAKATQGKLTDRTLFTRFEQFIGTPVYMSPEQASLSGLDVDTRSDIYGLGILLYELLTGKPPFDPKTLASAGYEEMRRIIREVEPPKPSSRLSTIAGEERTLLAKSRHIDPGKVSRLVEPDLDWIVMKAIEKDRTRRYETANGLALDIQRFLADEPVSATPPSAGYRLRKFTRRNKAALRVAASIAAVLVVATLMSTWQAVRATRAEKKTAETLAQVAAERDAKDLARKDAEAIAKFLGEVLQSPDPARNARVITVAELLDTAAQKLETDLASQPGHRAKLQATLGKTYYALGLYREAIPLQEKVRSYYIATLGREHPDTLEAMHQLVHSYRAVARGAEALKILEEVLPASRRVNGPEHPNTLHYINCLAISYDMTGRRDEALKMREELLPLVRKVNGLEDPVTLFAMQNLANSYVYSGRKVEALKLREEVLVLRRKVSGPDHPDTLGAMGDLANSFVDTGRKEEALKLREEVLALSRQKLGPEHPGIFGAMGNLANSYVDAGRNEAALKLREEMLALRRKVSGPDHPDTLAAMNNLGFAYIAADRTADALPLFVEASVQKPENTFWGMGVAVLQVWFGKDADYAATTRRMLAWAQAAAAKPEDFERVAKTACLRPIGDTATQETVLTFARKAVETGENGKSFVPWFRLALGMAEYRSGHYVAAAETLAAAAQSASSVSNDVMQARIEGIANFYRAMSLFQQGQLEEARSLLTAAETAMRPFPADDKNPLADRAVPDDIILWLACKEARALLNEGGDGQKK